MQTLKQLDDFGVRLQTEYILDSIKSIILTVVGECINWPIFSKVKEMGLWNYDYMKKWKFSSFYIFQLKVIAIFVSQRVCTYTRCIVSLMDGYKSITLNLLKVEGH